jgi:hypothetical protein
MGEVRLKPDISIIATCQTLAAILVFVDMRAPKVDKLCQCNYCQGRFPTVMKGSLLCHSPSIHDSGGGQF